MYPDDVALQNSNEEEVEQVAQQSFANMDYHIAAKAYTRLLELLTAKYKDENHDSLGDKYFNYGYSLLEVYRTEAGPLGDAVPREVVSGIPDEFDLERMNAEKEALEAEEKKEQEVADQDTEMEEAESGEAAGSSSAEPKPGSSSGNKQETAPAAEEDITDLECAWEALEMAKKIFEARGDAGKAKLADTLLLLAEVSLESGNYPAAIEDSAEALNIAKAHLPNDYRLLAESAYKLAGAYGANSQIDEAITNYQASVDYLNKKIDLIKDKQDSASTSEVREIGELIPEIEERLSDMVNLKAEMAAKNNSNGVHREGEESDAQSSKPANDISHLVKRKRKSDDDDDGNPSKKPLV